MSTSRFTLICASAFALASCSSGSEAEQEVFCPDPAYRDSVLVSNHTISYGQSKDEEPFDDAYYAFVADEAQMQKTSEESLAAFRKKVAQMPQQERSYMQKCYTDFADLATMAEYAYKDSDVKLPQGWTDLGQTRADVAEVIDRYCASGLLSSGLKCSLISRGDRYVLAFAGTDFPADWKDPVQIMGFVADAYEDVDGALNEETTQVGRASRMVAELIGKCGIPQDKLEFAGHSLGGRLSSEMAVKYGCPAVIFNAAGVSPEVYSAYIAQRKNPSSSRAGYIIDITSANDPLTCAQKYMSGSSDPYLSSVAGMLTDDKNIASSLLSLGKQALGMAAEYASQKSSVLGSLLGSAEEYYNRDYKALGARLIVKENMGGHGITPLVEALRSRAKICSSVN